MRITPMTEDVEIIQKLSTYPNKEEGLTADELKKKFDAGAVAIKEYLNETLVPEVQKFVEMQPGAGDFVSFLEQDLTAAQQTQARENINALEQPVEKTVTSEQIAFVAFDDFSQQDGRPIFSQAGTLEWLQSAENFDFHLITQIDGVVYDLTKADCEIHEEAYETGKIWYFLVKEPTGILWTYPLIVGNGVNPVTKEPEDIYGFTYMGFTPEGEYPNLWFYRITTTERKLQVITSVNGIEADENGNVDVAGGGSDVYILADGETIEDAPEDAEIVIDPNEEVSEVDSIVIRSSTAGSTKKFKLTVDDTGTITATQVT